MDYFAGALLATQYNKISYHESHDEAGNDANTERTIVTVVNRAPLIGIYRGSMPKPAAASLSVFRRCRPGR